MSDLDERDIEVGATDAVLQTFVATDAVPGEDLPVRLWAVSAMAEAGRTVHVLVVLAADTTNAPTDALAEAILGSAVLDVEPLREA